MAEILRNEGIALMQLEQSLNNFQNSLTDENGNVRIAPEWFAIYDDLLCKLLVSRSLADKVNGEPLSKIDWEGLTQNIGTC